MTYLNILDLVTGSIIGLIMSNTIGVSKRKKSETIYGYLLQLYILVFGVILFANVAAINFYDYFTLGSLGHFIIEKGDALGITLCKAMAYLIFTGSSLIGYNILFKDLVVKYYPNRQIGVFRVFSLLVFILMGILTYEYITYGYTLAEVFFIHKLRAAVILVIATLLMIIYSQCLFNRFKRN